MRDTTFTEARTKAEHLKALGDTTVYLRDDADDLPWGLVTSVKTGGIYRMSGPTSAWIIADIDGIEYQWSVNFEGHDASGRGVSMFDEKRLREVMMRLPAKARSAFSEMLQKSVLPQLTSYTDDIRKSLHRQWDSEDCVRGLIAFADRSLTETSEVVAA